MKANILLRTALVLVLMLSFSSCKDDKKENTSDLPKVGNVELKVGTTSYTIPASAHNETYENQGGAIVIGQNRITQDYVQIYVANLNGLIKGGEYLVAENQSETKFATFMCTVNEVSYTMISGSVMVSKITSTEYQGSFTGIAENVELSSDTKTISGAFNLIFGLHSSEE